jgi:hypothetical protein
MTSLQSTPTEFHFAYGLSCTELYMLEIPFKIDIFDRIIKRFLEIENVIFDGHKLIDIARYIDTKVDKCQIASAVSEFYALNYARYGIYMTP